MIEFQINVTISLNNFNFFVCMYVEIDNIYYVKMTTLHTFIGI